MLEAADAGVFALAIAAVKVAERSIDAVARRYNSKSDIVSGGNHGAGNAATSSELEQSTMLIRSDLRMAALEQGHLQKTVERVHKRLDKLEG